jgi:folate-binding protein YgfZ
LAISSPHAELHTQAGAALGEFFGCLLPRRYVETKAECQFARAAGAVFDTSFRAVFSLSGPDAVRFLNAVSTANIADLKLGQGVRGLLLNPQGHILAELTALAAGDRLLAFSHLSVRERTAAHLEKYIIMDDVQLEDWTERFASLAMEGSALPRLARNVLGWDLDAEALFAHRVIEVGGARCTAVRSSFFGEVALELFVERRDFPTEWRALQKLMHGEGGGAIGYEALNALRLEAGIPWFGYDFDDRVIPHEAGLESSHISYGKGCYTGQEIVERVRSRGHVNRRLARLQFLGISVPPPGTKLLADDKEAGTVTSAAFSPHLGRVFGLGYIRREFLEAGTLLSWSEGEVEVM